jgi:phosphonopyruvate decarboxylase
MIDLQKYLTCLKDSGVQFISGVPDTLLNDLCLAIESDWPKDKHVLAANEGNAIALAAGYQIATGTVPIAYMQNSGLGNATNPLISLTDNTVYAIPMVMLIGWRGDPGSSDWPQHKRQGELTPEFLDALKIPYRILEGDAENAIEDTEWAIQTAAATGHPTALLAKKGVFEKGEKARFTPADSEYTLSREEAMAAVLDCAPKDAICVATTGRATRELHELRNVRGEGHSNDFLNVGAMGHTSSIAAGIASAHPERTVICFDGDAAALMHMGCFAINASLNLPNFLHIVLNNGVHESVGGQTSVGHQADYTGIARAAGYKTGPAAVTNKADLQAAVSERLAQGGPAFIDMRIRKGMRTDLPKLIITPVDVKKQLMSELG